MLPMNLISRRESIKRAAFLVGGLCACGSSPAETLLHSTSSLTPVLEESAYAVLGKKIKVDLDKAKYLTANGDAALLKDPQRQLNLVIIRLGRNKYKVLTASCTHAGRPLAYNRHRKILQCVNFHHSIFDLDGKVVKGPAPDPIKAHTAQVNKGFLTIEL